MAYSSLLLNITGILGSMFRLGKAGPHLRQGTLDPNTQELTGGLGDLYIQHGSTQRIFQKKEEGWVDVRVPITTRKSVQASSYSIGELDSYIGVDYQYAVQLTLPLGTEGRTITIKDESGESSSINPITILGRNSELIEGQGSFVIDAPYGSITLVYGNTEWGIVNSWGFDKF